MTRRALREEFPGSPDPRPTQAVILAGGRGTRMSPLTDNRPKPMIDIRGRPFLDYLLEQLADQGFQRVLLLLGYLPEVIRDYCGAGERWGLQIEYSVSAVDDLTSRRVQLAYDKIEPCFLLMYCDNYWPLQMDRHWARFREAGVPAMITVYRNRDHYSRDSVIVGPDGYVTVYDRSRTHPGLQGIEISYAILRKEVLDLLPADDALIEDALYPTLTAQRRLAAFVSDHRYYSVGSPARLPLTEAFFERTPTVILDRDGVLNEKPPRAQYVRTWAEFRWLDGAKEALRLLHERGYRVIVVSNQAGIARGAMTDADLAAIHEALQQEVALAGGGLAAIYHCPHAWDDGCECRKPAPGMLFQAQRDFSLDLTRTVLIGDDERDAEAARSAGCRPILVTPERSLRDIVRELVGALPLRQPTAAAVPA